MCAADFYMSLYNVIFTVLPPLVIGIFDQDVDREISRLYPGQPIAAHPFSPVGSLADRDGGISSLALCLTIPAAGCPEAMQKLAHACLPAYRSAWHSGWPLEVLITALQVSTRRALRICISGPRHWRAGC